MTTTIVPNVTDELIEELEAAANAATPGPWEHLRINDISWVASEEWEILDLRCDKPLDAEDGEFIAQANPATILALLQHVREMKVDAERYRLFAATVAAEFAGLPLTGSQKALFDAMNSREEVSGVDDGGAMFDAAMTP